MTRVRALKLAGWLVLALSAAPRGVWAQSGAGDGGRVRAPYRAAADSIIQAATRDSAAYRRLARLVDGFGHRLSGSASLEAAIDWILGEMRGDGLENVRGEPVMVPRWVRGEESAELIAPRRQRLPMLGLGGSIGTPRGGITAEVLVVGDFADLEARAADARGKIVLFDVPYTSYGQTVRYRSDGAVAAARVGAVASLIRSVASYSLRSPHTGMMSYDSTVGRIPHAAITVEDAAMLHRMQERGERILVRLTMEARTLPDAPSRNVVADLVGAERPEEVVVVGGHLDSWDVGQGAVDDGGGSVAAWEAVRLLRQLGMRPRRTVRVVLFTNEENGLRGGTAYRDAHAGELDDHVLAIESDGGVFRPRGFGFSGSDSAYALVREVGSLLDSIGADSIERGGGGADIGPIIARGVPGMGLNVDGERYFWFHHSEADTIDKLDPGEMSRCVAALAVMAYVVADLPDRLPRRPLAP
ncbi:MAG: M20/M25/M40 family metallo-hydrolase [Gemmatimonadetes bacterium]|nr:M20/M25/M40 family metallo-hydrolase [Gemmatimonadota bacterium]